MRLFPLKQKGRLNVVPVFPNFRIFPPLEDFGDAFCVAGVPFDAPALLAIAQILLGSWRHAI